jgi:hypothetical protein
MYNIFMYIYLPEEEVTFHSARTVKFAKSSPKMVSIDPGLNLTKVLDIDTYIYVCIYIYLYIYIYIYIHIYI